MIFYERPLLSVSTYSPILTIKGICNWLALSHTQLLKSQTHCFSENNVWLLKIFVRLNSQQNLSSRQFNCFQKESIPRKKKTKFSFIEWYLGLTWVNPNNWENLFPLKPEVLNPQLHVFDVFLVQWEYFHNTNWPLNMWRVKTIGTPYFFWELKKCGVWRLWGAYWMDEEREG